MDPLSSTDWVPSLIAAALDILQQLAHPLQLLARYQCRDAIHAIISLPPRQFHSGWAQCQLGRAYFELADYKMVLFRPKWLMLLYPFVTVYFE